MESTMEYWDLLLVAHKYLVYGLMEHCKNKLSDIMASLDDNDELIAHVNISCQLYTCEDIAKAGVKAIKEKLQEIIASEAWLTLPENIIMDLVDDAHLKVTEGQLFTGIIKWCGANTKTEQEAIQKFQHDFANKIIAENISESEFMETFQPLVKFIPDPLFKQWPFEIIQNKCKQATRF